VPGREVLANSQPSLQLLGVSHGICLITQYCPDLGGHLLRDLEVSVIRVGSFRHSVSEE
jgi:hypothetical protein